MPSSSDGDSDGDRGKEVLVPEITDDQKLPS